MKKVIMSIILSIVMVGLVACSVNESTNNVADISVKELMEDVKEQLAKNIEEDSGDNLLEDDGTLSGYIQADLVEDADEEPFVEMLIERTELAPEILEEGQFLAPMMNVNSNEIIILKAKDKADVDSLKEALEREQDVQIGIWEQYLPDQYEKVKKNIIKTSGNYLLFVTADDASSIEALFDEKVK